MVPEEEPELPPSPLPELELTAFVFVPPELELSEEGLEDGVFSEEELPELTAPLFGDEPLVESLLDDEEPAELVELPPDDEEDCELEELTELEEELLPLLEEEVGLELFPPAVLSTITTDPPLEAVAVPALDSSDRGAEVDTFVF